MVKKETTKKKTKTAKKTKKEKKDFDLFKWAKKTRKEIDEARKKKAKQKTPYKGKGAIRAKVLDKTKVRNILNIEEKFSVGEFVLLGEAEYYDLQNNDAVELSEGAKKELSKRKKKTGFFEIDENDLDTFLGGSDEPPKRLGQGIHEGQFYYGIKTNNGYGIVTSQNQFYPAYEKVVINGKKLDKIPVDKIKEEFGLDYLTGFDGNAVDTIWSKKDTICFLKKESKTKTVKVIFQSLTEKNKEHVWHPDNGHHKLVAGFTIATYCFQLFDTAPRLNIFALTESGKSTQSKQIKYSCFNPIWFSKGTDASLFRSVEGTCGVPILDNFDKLGDDLKETTFHFIETSFDREGKYRLCETTAQKNWGTRIYLTFCPMVINSTIPFEDAAVENRCILIRMEKTKKRFKKLKPKEAFWKNIRNDCRLWVLESWQEIEKTRD